MAKRILTIDDSKTMRDMLMLTLADAGFDVLQAIDGQDALDVLGDQQVDVIITDINMPRMDGYEVIRQLRGNPIHKRTPILVLTTESESSKKNLAREVGATGWMVKKSLAAAQLLAQQGISAEVVDPRTLAPLDVETILKSVKKTGRLNPPCFKHQAGSDTMSALSH